MEKNDSKSYGELITFMKSIQEYTSVPFEQPVELESSPQGELPICV